MSKYAAIVFGFAAVLVITAAILFFETSKKNDAAKVAEITEVHGETSSSGTLLAEETFVTGPQSSAVLTFRNGLKLKVTENTNLVTEFESTGRAGVLVTVLDGRVEFLANGSDDRIKVFKNGSLITKDSNPTFKPLVIKSEPVVADQPAQEVNVSASQPDDSPTPAENVAQERPKTDPNDTKLDDQEIEDAVIGKRALFQRCYLSFLQRKGKTNISGRVNLSFVIENNGRVSSQKIVQSPFQDDTLNNCLLEVVSRILFQPYEGARVVVSDFPIELQ
jgi:TonB family protein